jgi:hypothetical protein
VRLSVPVTNHPSDDRPPIAVASQWVSRVITVSLEMVVPGLVGLWVDCRLGTKGLFSLIGFVGGVVMAFWHLLRMTRNPSHPAPHGHDSQDRGEGQA